MSLLINKDYLGFSHHALLSDGMLKWTKDESQGDYYFGFCKHPKSIEPLLTLFEEEVSELVPNEVKVSFKECGYEHAPWSVVIPTKRYKKLLAKFVDESTKALEIVKKNEYSGFFSETNDLFSLLKGSYISVDECKEYLLKNDNHVLKSITNMASFGRLPVPQYNRVSTKTGRLTIKAGPQFLTMKKEHRSVFRPSVPNKKIYEIDFTSLEPRVASNIANRKTTNDVYMSFVDSSKISITREVAKLAVLCALYGAGESRLSSVLRKDNPSITAKVLIKKVKEYFGLSSLTNSLRTQSKSGYITNCFGRPIFVDDSRDSILVNNFLQSSAVDIALLGFLDFCTKLKNIVDPLFIIHDALIFEANPKDLPHITEYVDKGFELKEVGNFPLKITEFGHNE